MKYHKAMFFAQTPNGKWIFTHSEPCACRLDQNHEVRKDPK